MTSESTTHFQTTENKNKMPHDMFQKLPATITTSFLLDADSLGPIQQKLKWSIDMSKIIQLIRGIYIVPKMVYFTTGHPTKENEGYRNKLQLLGYQIVSRDCTTNGAKPEHSEKIAIEIALEATLSGDICEHVILLTRNPNLESIGRTMKDNHRILTLLSDKLCPTELRFSATHFVELNQLQAELSRP